MKRRVLVTGGSGFVGSRLAHRLAAAGHEVHLLLRPGHEPRRLAALPDARRHLVDLTDKEGVDGLVQAVRPSWIFHLAVYGAYSWQDDPLAMIRTNIVGTAHLVEAALVAGFDAFINTGSSSEYGFQPVAPDEDTPPAPNSYYAVTKSAATSYCQFAARHHDTHLVTLRLYSVYGPGEDHRRLIPSLIAAGGAGEWPRLAAPEIARDFVYVDDVVRAYVLAAEAADLARGTIFNVGSGTQTTLRDITDVAANLLEIEVPPPWQTMARRSWDTTTWVADPRRIRERLGWRAEIDLVEGLRRTIALWPWS